MPKKSAATKATAVKAKGIEKKTAGKEVATAAPKAAASGARAAKLQKLLETAGISASINPDKPRKGCFEVRTAGGDKVVSLVDLPRPFNALKALDIDALAEQVKTAVAK